MLFSLSSGLRPIPVFAMASQESRRYGVAPKDMDETIKRNEKRISRLVQVISQLLVY